MPRATGQGRKPKPTAQKLAAGNPGKRQINRDEPQFTQLTNAACPDWLDEIAQVAWDTVCPELCERGVLTAVDLPNLEVWCKAYSRWRLAEEDISQNGIVVDSPMGGPKKNPACTVANESIRQLNSVGGLLGLDPSSRTRIVVPNGSKRENPFLKLLKGATK